MTISDQSRHQLHRHLDEVLGPDHAATLMAHLPPVGWADVATKRDLEHFALEFRSALREELVGSATGLREELVGSATGLREELVGSATGLRGEIAASERGVRGEIAASESRLRGEIAASETGLRGEIAASEARLRAEIGELRTEVVGIRSDMARQVPTLFLGLVGLQVSAAGLTVALSKLL